MKAIMIPTESTAVGYYRITMIADNLRKLGWDVPALEAGEYSPERLGELCEGADIIVSQRPGTTRSVAALRLAADVNKCPLVYDIDDNFMDISEMNPFVATMTEEDMNAAMVGLNAADWVTVSTPSLKQVYTFLNPNIVVLRNCQDMTDWDIVREGKDSDTTVIGWAGSASHYDDLKIVARAIKRVLRQNKNVEFHVTGIVPDFLTNIKGVKLLRIWFEGVKEYHQGLADLGFDIGIVPLVDREFNRGKSNIKWQEYTLANIPTIASPVGEYLNLGNEVIWAKDDEMYWVDRLNLLINDTEARQELLKNSRKRIAEEFDIADKIKDWDREYKRIIRTHKPGKLLQ